MERREQHVPSRMVSSIYRLSPPEHGYASKEEQERRLKLKVRRLVAEWGVETVVRMIRKHEVHTPEDENRKAWLVLTAYAEDVKGQRQASW